MQTQTEVPRHRIDALSDGVYAIAITLLVLELKLPALSEGASDQALRAALVALMPKVLMWLLSFWVMVIFWLAQQRQNHFAQGLDRPGLIIELAQLAFISLLPFSTALIGEHGDLPSAAALYAANLLALALLGFARALHLARTPALQAGHLTPALKKSLLVRSAAVVVLCAVAFALAFVVPGWNMLAMLPLALLRSLGPRRA